MATEFVKKPTDKKFDFEKIEFREPTVKDAIQAEKISGVQMGRKYDAALVSEVCTFDGKKLLMEDILDFPEKFFFQVQDALTDGQLSMLQKELFSLQLKQISDMGTSQG